MEQIILSLVRKAVQDYQMIGEHDCLTVGVSGGKDSLLTLWALANLRRFYPVPFTLKAITLDMGPCQAVKSGVGEDPWGDIRALCADLEVSYTVLPTHIFEVIFDIRKETNPCSLCAKMRRGALNEAALAGGSHSVALGHHKDDAVETFLLSLLFEGRLSCFRPVTYLDRKDVTVIRPLLYATELQVRTAVDTLKLPVYKNPCPANGNTKRQEVKELFTELEERYPELKDRVFGAMTRYPLGGWDKEI